MIRYTKYLLLPITIVAWYLLTYYSLFISVVGIAKIFTFRLIWIIVFDSFIFGVLYFLAVGLPSLLKTLIMMLFKQSLSIAILHTIAGVIGIVLFIIAFIKTPPMIVGEEGETFILVGMWQMAPLKTILLVFPFIGLFISLLYASIIFPIEVYSELDD